MNKNEWLVLGMSAFIWGLLIEGIIISYTKVKPETPIIFIIGLIITYTSLIILCARIDLEMDLYWQERIKNLELLQAKIEKIKLGDKK